jgi:DNA-directed RNA polymerase subunit RPC12/RpoP
MENQFECPGCGAPLDTLGQVQPTIICQYCHTRVVVPPELRLAAEPVPVDAPPIVPEEIPRLEDVLSALIPSSKQGKVFLLVIVLVIIVSTCIGLSAAYCGTLVGIIAPLLTLLGH